MRVRFPNCDTWIVMRICCGICNLKCTEGMQSAPFRWDLKGSSAKNLLRRSPFQLHWKMCLQNNKQQQYKSGEVKRFTNCMRQPSNDVYWSKMFSCLKFTTMHVSNCPYSNHSYQSYLIILVINMKFPVCCAHLVQGTNPHPIHLWNQFNIPSFFESPGKGSRTWQLNRGAFFWSPHPFLSLIRRLVSCCLIDGWVMILLTPFVR